MRAVQMLRAGNHLSFVRTTLRVFGLLSLRIREAMAIVALLGLYAVLEGVGIGLLLPVLQYLETGGQSFPSDGIWTYLLSASDKLGIPINLATLLLFAFTPILIRQGVYYLNTWYVATVQNRAVEKLTVRSFRAVANSDMAYLDKQDIGRLIGLVTGQVSRCGETLSEYLRMLSAVTIIVIYAVLLGALSWQLATVAVLAMLGVSAAIRWVMIRAGAHGAALTDASQAMSSAVRERLSALRLVKMRAREDEEADRVGDLATVLRRANTRIVVGAARVEVIVDPALMLAVFVILYFGFNSFGLTLSSLGLFMFVLLRLNSKAKDFNVSRHNVSSLLPSFDYVEEMLNDAEAAPTPRGGAVPFTGLHDELQFHDVHFSYTADGEEVLKGVSLTVPRRSTTAIVGRSGAGKSTLVDMVPALRRPTSGCVRIDGVDASEFELRSLRRGIGLLTQEPILFNGSIYSNLIYGLDALPSDSAVQRALDESYCTEFVESLPDGLETQIGDRGVRFSGGQRQRLALARVLLQRPDILILDEPTSALDSESEHYIQQAFERIAEQCTVIVIAHRLATVQRADQIVVLSDGIIVEQGKHAELIAREGGVYRRLFDMQIRA